MKKTAILFVIIILLGCSAQRQIYQQKFQGKIEIPSLPKWVYEPPAGSIVGIAFKSIDEDKMKNTAKDMMTVIQSRNESSYTITKYASTTKDDQLASQKYEFNLNVSSNPKLMKEIYDNSKQIASFQMKGYYIALFSKQKLGKINSEPSVQSIPEKFENNCLEKVKGGVICHNTSSSSSLIIAWEEAANEARLEIAKYRNKNIQSALINVNDNIDKRIAVETEEKLLRTKIIASFIVTELIDNLRIYKVYHQIRQED